jgi:hypothetical protein
VGALGLCAGPVVILVETYLSPLAPLRLTPTDREGMGSLLSEQYADQRRLEELHTVYQEHRQR